MGWVPAKELQPGQMLEICDPVGIDDCDRPLGKKAEDLIFSGQRWQAEVMSAGLSGGCRAVYNIEVEDFHSYFVGPFGVWVHNKNQGEPVFTQELKLSSETAQPKGRDYRPNVEEMKASGKYTQEQIDGAIGENQAADILAKYDNLRN